MVFKIVSAEKIVSRVPLKYAQLALAASRPPLALRAWEGGQFGAQGSQFAGSFLYYKVKTWIINMAVINKNSKTLENFEIQTSDIRILEILGRLEHPYKFQSPGTTGIAVICKKLKNSNFSFRIFE